MSNSYWSDGERWICRIHSTQCEFNLILDDALCQGVSGHGGEHWIYKKNGSYSYHDNDSDPASKRDKHGVAGWIPPDNANWISPVQKFADYHMGHFMDSSVIDPDLIAKLDCDAEVGGIVSRPCTADEIKQLEIDGRLDFIHELD